MKKLALLLGALSITATAFAGGKEIVPQGKEVTPVKEVVKEVIVYRNSPAVRSAYPNGSVNMYYKWWGKSSADKHHGSKDYQSNGNRGRLHLEGSINMTEKDNFYFRVRDNQALSDNGNYEIKENYLGNEYKTYGHSGSSTQVRLRYSHTHDFLDGIATSRLHYQNDGEYTGFAVGKQDLEYQMRFNFAKYGFDNDFIKSTSLTVAPKIGYAWNGDRDGSYKKVKDPATGGVIGEKFTGNEPASVYYGLDLETYHVLPWNFAFEFNVRTTFAHANQKAYNMKYDAVDHDGYYAGSKSGFQAYVEAYLSNDTKLFDLGDSAKLSFHFEGGFDPYRWSNKRQYKQEIYPATKAKNYYDKSSYSLYALPALKLDYQINESINTFLYAGAEMRNIHEASTDAQGFVWQPVAWAGFKVSF